MKNNVGSTDQIIRYILGIIFIIAAVIYFNAGTIGLGVLFSVLALISIATAAMKFCALYSLFGISTCKVDTSQN